MTDPAADPLRLLDAAAERRWTPLPGGRLAWRAWGAGPPLLLLHGAAGSWTHWLRNVAALAARHRVLAPDLPGHGDSDLPPGSPSVEALAGPIVQGLDALAPAPAAIDVAGFSMGGIVAGLVAAALGARARTLVLVGPNGMALPHAPLPALLRPEPGMDEAAAREVHRENLRRLMFADPAAADDLAARLQMDNVARTRFRAAGIPEGDALLRALPAVRARLAGLWGERDPYAAGHLDLRRQVLARFQPDVDFRVVPGAGHWVIYEAAGAVNAALLDMLAR